MYASVMYASVMHASVMNVTELYVHGQVRCTTLQTAALLFDPQQHRLQQFVAEFRKFAIGGGFGAYRVHARCDLETRGVEMEGAQRASVGCIHICLETSNL